MQVPESPRLTVSQVSLPQLRWGFSGWGSGSGRPQPDITALAGPAPGGGRWFGKSVGGALSPRLVIVPGAACDPHRWAAPEPRVPEKWPLPAGVSPGWGQGPEAGSDLVQRVLPSVSSSCSANRDGAARVQGH